MDFQKYLKTSAEEIDRELKKTFDKWSGEVGAVSPKLTELNNEFIRANHGGKRLRGALVKLGYEMAGGRGDEILRPAAAFEIFQTSILAHDDIIDQADLRRGRPTIYKALGGNHHGVSQTICLGDIGYFLAIRIIAEANFDSDRKNQALELFSRSMLDTALGQMLDVELPYRQDPKSEEDALTIFRLKTARYTIVGPLRLGAVLAGKDKELLDDIACFGEALGIAFQIQDDILGVFGDEKTLGKSVTSDIEEGKNTLLIIEALKEATSAQKAVLDKHYGHGKVNLEQLEKIRTIFRETGALKYSQEKAEKLVKEAKQVISQMKVEPQFKELLTQMAEFLVQRER